MDGNGARRGARKAVSRLFVVVVFAVGLSACADQSLPGKLLGTYKVTGQATVNSCGIASPEPWIFDVQLSEDGSTFYWSWMDGTPPLSAPLSTASEAILTSTLQRNVDPNEAGAAGPCTLQRDDRLDVVLASGSPPASFHGTIEYAISVVTGSDCSDQLVAAGGQYQALPCSIAYTITAARQ